MRLLGWLTLFAIALAVEVSVAPRLGAAVGLPLSALALLLGAVVLPFWPGLAFTVMAGVLRDVVAPAGALVHTPTGLVMFLALRSFMVFTPWDEPWRRIGALAIGIVGLPAARVLVAAVLRVWPGVAVPTYHGADLGTAFAARQAMAAGALFLAFAAWAIRSSARERMRRLQRLV